MVTLAVKQIQDSVEMGLGDFNVCITSRLRFLNSMHAAFITKTYAQRTF